MKFDLAYLLILASAALGQSEVEGPCIPRELWARNAMFGTLPAACHMSATTLSALKLSLLHVWVQPVIAKTVGNSILGRLVSISRNTGFLLLEEKVFGRCMESSVRV
ncbi:hypothetical protein GGI43DRAFT_406106 [Trichoderma evansii]